MKTKYVKLVEDFNLSAVEEAPGDLAPETPEVPEEPKQKQSRAPSKLTQEEKLALIDWIKKDNDTAEGEGFLAALVDLVDTAFENNEDVPRTGSERLRQEKYIKFFLAHKNL